MADRGNLNPLKRVPRAGFEGDEASGSSPVVEGKSAESPPLGASAIDRQGPSPEAAVTLSQNAVARTLAVALDDWSRNPHRKALRRVLLDLLRELENDA